MSESPTIYHWRIYCNTESQFVDYYGPTAPTTCPNDTAHDVNTESVQQIEVVGPNKVIATDTTPSDAPYQMTSFFIDVPTPSSVPATLTKDYYFPFDIWLWNLSLSQDLSNTGDVLDVQVGPDTPIGTLGVDAKTGATTIELPGSAIALLYRGDEIGFTDGKVTQYPGRITAIDAKASTVTVETALTSDFLTGSTILYSTYPMRNVICDYSTRMQVGSKGLRTKFIPANTVIRIIYTDNTMNTSDTRAIFQVEYYRQ